VSPWRKPRPFCAIDSWKSSEAKVETAMPNACSGERGYLKSSAKRSFDVFPNCSTAFSTASCTPSLATDFEPSFEERLGFGETLRQLLLPTDPESEVFKFLLLFFLIFLFSGEGVPLAPPSRWEDSFVSASFSFDLAAVALEGVWTEYWEMRSLWSSVDPALAPRDLVTDCSAKSRTAYFAS